MAIETAKDKIRINQKIGNKQEIISIDGDVIVNDIKPDVLKVLNTNGVVCLYKKEVLNGKIKLEGSVNTYIIYLADDEEESIRTINTSLDFAEIIDIENCKEGMTVDENILLKGFETKIINGRKLHIKAFLNIDLTVYSNTDVEMVIDIESNEGDIQTLNCTKKILTLVGENVGKTTLKDTINIDEQDELAEIMKVIFSFSNVETKISYNKVLIKGEANVGITYLTEDNRINDVNAIIPLMGFIDMPDVTDTSKCESKIKIKNLIIRQNNEDNNSLYIEADLLLFCRVYEEREVKIIEDAYAISEDINLKRENLKVAANEFKLRDDIEIREKLSNPPELIYGRIISVNTVPEIEDVEVKNGKIEYSGQLNVEFIVNSDNSNNTINNKIPFNFELVSNDITGESNVETEINVKMQKIESGDDGATLVVNLEVNATVQNEEDLIVTQDIEILDLGVQDNDRYSMVIYFVKTGDTLWNIAKQFKSKVEDIARVNGIEDESKIYPGEQLYIPKFTRNTIAM